jgi:Immunoglobulin domain
VSIEPRMIEQDEYSTAELRCSASGSPQPRIEWTRLDGTLSNDITLRDGYLRFNSLRKSDEGVYRCYARNEVGESEGVVSIYIRTQPTRPRPPVPDRQEVNIEPSQYSGEPGREVKLYCNSNPRGTVSWSKLGSPELPRNVYINEEELSIQYTTADDSGRYSCSVRFPNGVTRQAVADVSIVPRSNE